jgi:hypothetical protein
MRVLDMDAPTSTALVELSRFPLTDSSEINVESSDNQPTDILPRQWMIASFLPRMETIAKFSNITGAAVIIGALVQMYYSGLAPMDAWSAPAVYSFLAVMLLNVLPLFF